ncbi:hypothetical protein [Serpentinicella alkaliphila]|uniref:Lipoprotein n=1 Tax=Serpentinicella alkaliphila TaxID=1734049 RepID=A0A4R2T3A7_9FIRM|nr:hypothetical protein [Serpentinicella alkaliphila]QUH26194.1 hypothetical protein HZR23_10950 [Serpentinicella alkaliphila]TCP95716.1 hypothetical protein EDD79_105712 [Serpentinicella alkaliphila]
MKNRNYTRLVLSILIIISLVFTVGCNKIVDNDVVAYISQNSGSKHESTFKELGLGILFDFNLKIPRAEERWVELWVEGYNRGNIVEPPLTKLSYGLKPEKIAEGQMGFGIINSNSDKPLLFLYSEGIRIAPHSVDSDIFVKSSVSSWDYAISSGTFSLESEQEKVLAVYRQNEGQMRMGYNYEDADAIDEMIRDNDTVLLLKIRVDDKMK